MMEKRIKELRKSKKMTQTEFGARLGVKGNTITNYEKGIRLPSDAIITSICREFSVRREWLETGEGKMELETQSQTLDKIARRYSASYTFRAMLDVYAQMDEDGQRAVERYIELLANALATGRDPSTVDYEEVLAHKSDEYETALDGAAGESSGN